MQVEERYQEMKGSDDDDGDDDDDDDADADADLLCIGPWKVSI